MVREDGGIDESYEVEMMKLREVGRIGMSPVDLNDATQIKIR